MRKQILKFILLCIPLILGCAGLMLSGERPADSMYISICMYGMDCQDPTPNLLVELARWTAPLATASGVLMVFSRLRRRLTAWCRYIGGGSVAVYGPEREELLAGLGRRGIDGGGDFSFVRAGSYILLGREEENFDFYQRNRAALKGCSVYLQCRFLPAQSISDPELHLFSHEETAARLFWKKYCLFKCSVQNRHQMKIVFLGFGVLGEELLTYALQDNIFAPDQKIEYHIFGDGDRFLSIHTELGAISDPILFHREPWYESLSLIEGAQTVIILEQEEQLDLVKDLLLATRRNAFAVFASREELELLSGRERLMLFYWQELARKPEYIMGDALFERAKNINLHYASFYHHVPENEESKENEWVKLDAFTRYSNISAADYHEICRIMLKEMGQPVSGPAPECLELLSELEHIRWCRYHYLNNWKYGVPNDGKPKDAVRRIHTDLIPYKELPEEEKRKDRENIRTLLSMR